MKITDYGHAILISITGIFCLQFDSLLWNFAGGAMIGTGLFLAKRYGKNEGESN